MRQTLPWVPAPQVDQFDTLAKHNIEGTVLGPRVAVVVTTMSYCTAILGSTAWLRVSTKFQESIVGAE